MVLYSPLMLSAKFAVLRQIETIFYDHNRKKAAFKVIWGLIWANVLIYTATTFVFCDSGDPRTSTTSRAHISSAFYSVAVADTYASFLQSIGRRRRFGVCR